MFNFCPHCGKSIGVAQVPGQKVTCKSCGKEVGLAVQMVGTVHTQREAVDGTQQAINQGKAARCPLCQQVVEVRASGTQKNFVPHYKTGGPRKICPNSGKAAPA